jgi:hypothetical protein
LTPGRVLRRRWGAGALTAVVCLLAVVLVWLGWYTVRQWQQSLQLLAERQADQASDRFLVELTRDMQAVQRLVLLSPALDAFTSREPGPDPTYGAVNLVASAFARYAYPEAFFLWSRERGTAEPVFFYRRDRPVPWNAAADPAPLPVVVDEHASVGPGLLRRIQDDAAQGRRFIVFETQLDGAPYQVVARLLYRDVYRQNLEAILGFAVNLDWGATALLPRPARRGRIRPRGREHGDLDRRRFRPAGGRTDAGSRIGRAHERPFVPADVLQPGDCRGRFTSQAATPRVDDSRHDPRRFVGVGRLGRCEPDAPAGPGGSGDPRRRHCAQRARGAGPAAPCRASVRFRRQRDARIQDADRDHPRRRRNLGRRPARRRRGSSGLRPFHRPGVAAPVASGG